MDKSVLVTSPEPTKRSRADSEPIKRSRADSKTYESSSSRSPRLFSETSRDRSNPATTAATKSSKKQAAASAAVPTNNMRIHDFFSAAAAKTMTTKKENTTLPTTTTTTTMAPASTSTTTSSDSTTISSTTSTTTDWQAQVAKLQQLLQDKEEQLKAVSNNKTILHTALQSALHKTRQEFADFQESTSVQQASVSKVLEDLLRWKSSQQAKELRETLASDGARLGRIVYARAGMRALESWEEGHATKDLEHRKIELKQKRKALELRLQKSAEKENVEDALEAMEAKESVHMHMENLGVQERELAEEEQALNDQKGAHIRALKRVASEDASRFRSRPKVRSILAQEGLVLLS
jgi:hypothetical protein